MKQIKIDNGYELIADDERELVVIIDNNEVIRTKSVIIPFEGTLNEWIEVPQKIIEAETDGELKLKRIAELEEELKKLKTSI